MKGNDEYCNIFFFHFTFLVEYKKYVRAFIVLLIIFKGEKLIFETFSDIFAIYSPSHLF